MARSHLLTHEGHLFITGLVWRSILDVGQAEQEIRAYADDLSATAVVRLSTDIGMAVGLPADRDPGDVGTEKAQKKEERYSLAAAFARCPDVPENALLYLEIAEGIAVVGVRDGLVVTGYDSFAARVEQIALAKDFIQRCDGRGVTVYSNTRAFPGSIDFTLDNLIHDNLAQARIERMSENRWIKPALALLLVAILAVGGWWVYDDYQEEQARKEAAKKVDPNVLYLRNLPAALAQSGAHAGPMAEHLWSRLSKVPADLAGWQLAKVQCQAGSCEQIWENEGYSTFEAFKKASGGTPMVLSLDGRTITLSLNYELSEQGQEAEKLPVLDSYLLDVGSTFQARSVAGWKYDFSRPEAFGVPVGVVAAQVRNPVKVGGWKVTGDAWMVDGLYDLPTNMVLDSFVLQRAGEGFTFTAEGKFYVR